MIGKNSISGKALVETIEKIEAIRVQKAILSDDEKVIVASAKAAGYIPQFINLVIKARAAKPHDFQDYEQTRDLYLHAAGLAETPPLFRQLEAMQGEQLAHDALIDHFKTLVPRNGSFIFQTGNGDPVRIWRDTEGNAHHETVKKEAPRPQSGQARVLAPASTQIVPNCSEAEALVLGETAYRANQPITTNPFPFGDKRRAKWDKGWRSASGGDGMGPDDED